MSLFKPKDKINRFDKFDSSFYAKQGFKAIFLDIDNTIAIPDTGELSSQAIKFIDNLKKNNFKVLILSNNNKNRVVKFVGDYDVDYMYYALKPIPISYWLACLKMRCKPSQTIVIGDQLLTDILGANLSGCYGIYTKQLQEKDIPITARNRKIEKFIWRHILHEEM